LTSERLKFADSPGHVLKAQIHGIIDGQTTYITVCFLLGITGLFEIAYAATPKPRTAAVLLTIVLTISSLVKSRFKIVLQVGTDAQI
jgi:hypothetical protein